MSEGFVAGFVPRHRVDPAVISGAAENLPFAPIDLAARAGPAPRAAETATSAPGPKSFSPRPVGPKHFSPAPEPDPEPAEAPAWDLRSADPHAFGDPIERARADGFEEGVAHARALAEADRARDLALLHDLASRLGNAGRIDRDALATQLRATVLALARQLVGEVALPAERLAARAEAATALIADAAESAVLHLHPEDVALVKPHLPPTLHPLADEAVARGHFVLEAAATLVEDGPSHWLDQLEVAIERVALPR